MTDDDRLQSLLPSLRSLRSAFPPVDDQEPSRDLWPSVVKHIQAPTRPSWLDISLAAAIVVLLMMFPEWLLLLAYHL